MIVITPFGGHGTVYLGRRFSNMSLRPDTVFGWEPDLYRLPDPKLAQAFRKRAGLDLDLKATINENLMRMICYHFEERKWHTLLCGRCSHALPFLTLNRDALRALGVPIIGIVRHPMHAMVSFLSHQHPEHARRFGGFNSQEAVAWYASAWRRIVADMVDSGICYIARYEFLLKDLDYEQFEAATQLRAKLQDWDGNKRNHGDLGPENEAFLKRLMQSAYEYIYKTQWDI